VSTASLTPTLSLHGREREMRGVHVHGLLRRSLAAPLHRRERAKKMRRIPSPPEGRRVTKMRRIPSPPAGERARVRGLLAS
jgi:hypothetical protein